MSLSSASVPLPRRLRACASRARRRRRRGSPRTRAVTRRSRVRLGVSGSLRNRRRGAPRREARRRAPRAPRRRRRRARAPRTRVPGRTRLPAFARGLPARARTLSARAGRCARRLERSVVRDAFETSRARRERARGASQRRFQTLASRGERRLERATRGGMLRVAVSETFARALRVRHARDARAAERREERLHLFDDGFNVFSVGVARRLRREAAAVERLVQRARPTARAAPPRRTLMEDAVPMTRYASSTFGRRGRDAATRA